MDVRALKIDLLNRCNARCPFCPYHGEHGSVTKQLRARQEPVTSLAPQDFAALADACERLGLRPQFKFSGRGEATMHPAFASIVRLLAARGFPTRLISNGLLLAKHAEALAASGTDVVVSIHGPPAVHDAVMGAPRALARACDGIQAVRERGARVAVALILTPAMVPHLERLVAEYREDDVPVRVHHNFDPGVRAAMPLGALAPALGRIRAEHPEVRFVPDLAGPLLERYYGPGAFVLDPHRCARHANELEIDSAGTVSVCDSGPLGNIRAESFEGILAGAARGGFLSTVGGELASAAGLTARRCDRCCYQAPPGGSPTSGASP